MLDFLRLFFGIIHRVGLLLWRGLRWIGSHLYRGLRFGIPAFYGWVRAQPSRLRGILIAVLLLIVVAIFFVSYRAVRFIQVNVIGERPTDGFAIWFGDDPEARAALITTNTAVCEGAPFLLPTEGWIGLLYADPRAPYTESARHQGIDIFSPGEPGITPVYAAYDGYLSRSEGWFSAVIQRIPDDPLNPGRQIWVYYSHMGSKDGSESYVSPSFPPGTSEVFVTRGTLLGYTGNWAGIGRPAISTHLHFSIILDNGFGSYSNELDFNNSIDPSRYLGMPVNYACAPDHPICDPNPLCENAILSNAGG
jgi:peptidoglycan LD-endopeptidase LytH